MRYHVMVTDENDGEWWWVTIGLERWAWGSVCFSIIFDVNRWFIDVRPSLIHWYFEWLQDMVGTGWIKRKRRSDNFNVELNIKLMFQWSFQSMRMGWTSRIHSTYYRPRLVTLVETVDEYQRWCFEGGALKKCREDDQSFFFASHVKHSVYKKLQTDNKR